VPEAADWDDTYASDISKLSSCAINPEKFLKLYTDPLEVKPSQGESYDEVVAKTLYCSGKHIEFFDVPFRHPLVERVFQAFNDASIPDMSGDFEKMIASRKNGLRTAAKAQKEREEYMFERLNEFVRRAAKKEFPDLKDKEHIRILMILGGAHTRLYHKLVRKKEDVSRSFPLYPYIYPYFVEAFRREWFEKEVGDELAARTFLETVINGEIRLKLSSVTERQNLIGHFIRRIVERLNMNDARSVFTRLKKAEYLTEDLLSIITGEILKEKAIIIPQNEEELMRFLKIKSL